MRYDIRQRIRHALLNGDILAQFPKTQREQIFETVPEPNLEDRIDPEGEFDKVVKWDRDELDEARQLRRSLVGWLAFLYAGIEEANSVWLATPFEAEGPDAVGDDGEGGYVPLYEGDIDNPDIDFNFGTMLREAIARVARENGDTVAGFEFSVDTEPLTRRPVDTEGFDTEEVRKRFDEGTPLSVGEINHLRRETNLTKEDWDEYYERLDTERGSHRPDGVKGGQGGRGIDEMLEQAREEPASDDTSDE